MSYSEETSQKESLSDYKVRVHKYIESIGYSIALDSINEENWDVFAFEDSIVFIPLFDSLDFSIIVTEDEIESFKNKEDPEAMGLAYHRIQLKKNKVPILKSYASEIEGVSEADLILPSNPPHYRGLGRIIGTAAAVLTFVVLIVLFNPRFENFLVGLLAGAASGLALGWGFRWLGYLFGLHVILRRYSNSVFYPWLQRVYGDILSKEDAFNLLSAGAYRKKGSFDYISKGVYYLASIRRGYNQPNLLFVLDKARGPYLWAADGEIFTKDLAELFDSLYNFIGLSDYIPATAIYSAERVSDQQLSFVTANNRDEKRVVCLSSSPTPPPGIVLDEGALWKLQPWSKVRKELVNRADSEQISILTATNRITHVMPITAVAELIRSNFYLEESEGENYNDY